VFYNSCQELLTLRCEGTIEDFLTRIKVLNEKIDATKIDLTADKRTLLTLMLGLPTGFESLIQIWGTMPDLTAEQAVRMLRAEDRRIDEREKNPRGVPERHMAVVAYTRGQKRKAPEQGEPANKRPTWPECDTCKRRHPGACWTTITCYICDRKGHPAYKCHEKEDIANTAIRGESRRGRSQGAKDSFRAESDEDIIYA